MATREVQPTINLGRMMQQGGATPEPAADQTVTGAIGNLLANQNASAGTGLLGQRGSLTTTPGAGGIDTTIYDIGAAPEVAQATATTVDPNSIATVSTPTMKAPDPLEAVTATAVNADWRSYDPTLISKEQQSQMMVDQQMGKYLNPGSAINQQVISAANEESASRGLLNSSMATGNAMSAMTKLAAQLGTSDANTIYNVAVQNMGAENAAKEFAADAFNKASIVNAQNGTQVNIANAQFKNDTARFNVQQATEILKANTANALQANIINAEQANAVATLNAQLLTNTDLSNVRDANSMATMVFQQATNAGMHNAAAMNAASITAADIKGRLDAATIGANATIGAAGIHAGATIAAAEIRAASDAAGLKLDQQKLDVLQRGQFADDFMGLAEAAQKDINGKAGDPIAQQAAADDWTALGNVLAAISGASTTIKNSDGTSSDLVNFGTYWDPDAYMAANPDIASSGSKLTAEQHYTQFGQAEGRTW